MNVLVPLTGGHSVFYLNYSIIYIKVTGIFLRFIIRDNNLLCLYLIRVPFSFSSLPVLRILGTCCSPFSSTISSSIDIGPRRLTDLHIFPAPFLFSLFFSIYYSYIYVCIVIIHFRRQGQNLYYSY